MGGLTVLLISGHSALSRIWFKSRGSSQAAPGLPLSVVHCLLSTLQPSCEKGIILPILQVRKLRFKEVESFVQGNTARKKQSWNSRLGHPASKTAFWTRFHTRRVQPPCSLLPEESEDIPNGLLNQRLCHPIVSGHCQVL